MEAIISVAIASFAALGTLTRSTHNRFTELDRRIDAVELKIAESYVSKQDLSEIISRMETHMVRIENKLDKLNTCFSK